MSPTAVFTQPAAPCTRVAGGAALLGAAGVYPGWCGTGWGREGCYTGYPTRPSQDPIFSIFLRLRPTYGQMKAFLLVSMRFPRMGPRIDQN